MADEPQEEEVVETPAVEEEANDDAALETVAEFIKEEDASGTAPEPEQEPETEPETEPEQPAVPEDAPPEYSEALLREAESIGMTWEEVRQYSPAQLQGVINRVIRTVQSYQNTQPQQQTEEAKPEEEIELNPEDYDEKIIAKFARTEKQLAALEKRNAEQEQLIQHLRGETEKRAEQEQLQQFEQYKEGFLKSVYDAGLPDLFGNDARTCTDEQWNGVMRLYNFATDLKDFYESRGQQPPDDLFQRALFAEFGNRIKQGTVEEISRKVQRRSGQSLQRPTQRTSTDSTGDEAAIAAAAEGLQAMED